MTTVTMGDREMATDLLHTQKQTTADYNANANECAHPEIKSVFLDLLQSEQSIGHDLFCAMQNRGWYPTEEAPEEKKTAIRNQFCTYRNGLCN